MVQKIFNRFGLRREFNLSDLTDSTAALNNILGTPSMLGTEESFTTNDLEPIIGIFLTNITLSTFTGLAGTTVTFTKIDDNGVITDDTVVYRPLIKIKTQLDSSFFSSGEPFFLGGDGPNAFYYDSDKIVRNPEPLDTNQGYSFGTIVLSNGGIYRALTNALAPVQLTPETASTYNFEFIRDWNGIQDIFFNDELDPVTNEVVTISDRFWERGQFAFTSKIQTSFLSLFGGVNWKGFYKPTSFGTTEFFLSTTGSTIFKFQDINTSPFQQVRYGKPDVNIINTFKSFIANPALISNRYNLNNIQNIVDIYDDLTRQLVQVTLPKKQRLSNGDFIFLEVSEGQVKTRRYNVLTHRSGVDNTGNGGVDERDLIYFFIEVTKDFNILNVDINTLPLSGTGSSEDLVNGNITEATSEVLSGLLATIRYSPYERRTFDTYLYSTTHKLEIPPATYTVTGNTITCDDFYYKHLMENDYIYDYRRRTTDNVQSVRRFIVNSLDDSTNTATVAIDPSYTISSNSPNSDNNDQFYYVVQGNTSVSGTYDGLVDNPGLFLEKSWTDNTSTTMFVFSNTNVTFNNTNTAITTENMGVTGATQTYFEENNEYLVRFNNIDSVYRTFNYILHGAPGGNTNGGSGAKIEGVITFRRNIWYKIVIGKSGELEGLSEVGGGGAAGVNISANTSAFNAYSGGGYSGIHDLDLAQSNVNGSTANQEPLTQENMVVIAAGGGGGTSTSGGGGDAGTPIGSDGTGTRRGGGGGTIGGSAGSGGTFGATTEGSALQGGDGQFNSNSTRYAGAGGGGGYFGGGGGGNQNSSSVASAGGGGGGGSAISVSSLTVTKTESPGSEEITNVVTTGTIGDTIDTTLNGIDELVFVGRYGEDITRQKRIVLNYSLEEFVDYAFDWAFYIKDEDVNTRSNNKVWTISKREQENPNFQTLNYKFLYDIDYDFFKIGDFKNFAENSMFTNGTSRETGVNQLAFGKPQLLEKGDQYNVFYNLLPIISTYQPPINFNEVVKTGNGNLKAKSRVLVSAQFTDFEIGNYVIDNTLSAFRGDITSIIPRGTRVIEIPSSGFTNIVLSKTIDTNVNSQPYAVIDHRGFICTCTLQPTGSTPSTIAGSDVIIRGQSNEVKVGMALCVQDQPSKSTYTRITSISEDLNGDTIVTLDSDLLSTNEIGAIVYADRGVDIVEPLREFCGDSICGQNNFQGSKPKTKYISTIAHVGVRNDSLDVRWRENSLVGSYSPSDQKRPHRRTYFPDGNDITGDTAVDFRQTTNQGPTVAWWVDANIGQTIDDQAILSNGASNSPDLNTGRGSKRYGSMQVWARFKKTGAGAYTTGIANAIIEKYPSFPIDDTFWPIGIAEALLRVNGDLRTNTDITNSHKYYFIVRVNEKIKSVPNAQNGYTATWTDSTTASDGNTLLPVTLDLTEFSTDLWDLREIVYPQGNNQTNIRDFFSSISSESQLNSNYTNLSNNPTSATYRDHYYRITGAGFTISQASAEGKFLNPNSLIRDDGNGNITYELRPGEILVHIGTTGYWTHFDTLESAVDTQVAFTFKPDPIDGGINNQSANESELINLFPGVGGKSATFINSGEDEDQLRFMQYRDKVYELIPNPTVIENRFTGIRMINPNSQSTYTRPDGTIAPVETNLQNSTNALSVYTFTSTTDLKELCCPPLDTSPPFDSSEIGLSTTQSNPDMNIDGLVNIRSFSGNHPTDRILSIVTASNSDLPVTEKIELLFGNEKYKLLVGDSIPGTL